MAWRPTVGPWKQSGFVMRATALREDSPNVKIDVEELVRSHELDNALVFVNESWRARLQGRLRVAGLRPYNAVRAVDMWDACTLQTALDAEEDVPGSEREAALDRIAQRAFAGGAATPYPGADVSFSPTGDRSPRCIRELERDTAGVVPYATFLSRMRFGGDGRVGGPVVFAIDQGERNERLRQRFGGRQWFRLVRVTSATGASYTIVPYSGGGGPEP
jgi:hypothetical protein